MSGRREQASAALRALLELGRRGALLAREGSLGAPQRPAGGTGAAVDRAFDWGIGGLIVVLLAVAPLILPDFELSVIGIQTMWYGIAAASLVFLAGYGGMISLAQTAMFGIAGLTMANLAASEGGSDNNHLFGLEVGPDNWGPWAAAAGGIVVAVLCGLVFGAIASRSEGIYFLMLTLAIGVIAYYFYGQVEQLSGFGGLNNVPRPGVVGSSEAEPERLYYTALICAAAVYLLLRYVVRTPFGLTLQGIRDDPVRMRSLGYNVTLHRMLAFAFGAFVASIAGILSVWDKGQISAHSINLTQTIIVLAIAVVGGMFRLEGAWVGALAFTLTDYLLRRYVTIERLDTYFGLVFLVIILASPGGLMGLWGLLRGRLRRALQRSRPAEGSPA